MPKDFPSDNTGSGNSFLGCLGIMAALFIVFGILCAVGGYLVFGRFARLKDVRNQEVADNKKDADVKSTRSVEEGPAEGPAAVAEMRSKNRLRRIMIAMHGHHSQFRTFPPPSTATFDGTGKPLLSWRVHLLPQLGENPLYGLFHLDEPWDSEHNRALLEKMPDVYLSRGISSDGNRTGFVLFQDPEMYQIGKSGPDIRRMSDGTSNTLLVVEVGPELAVPWTRPDDIPFDSAQPLLALGGLPNGGFWGGFADGAVRKIKSDIKAEVFRGLLTPSGGEVIQLEREVEFP